MKNLDVHSQCQNKKIILTDFFDTVCHRKVSETDVLNLWANKISWKYKAAFSGAELLHLRKIASTKLRCESLCEENKYEDIIGEVYSMLHTKLWQISKENFVEDCKSVELECEIGILFVDEELVSILKELKKEGKNIYLVSDFYFSSNDINYLLKKLQIDRLFSGVYVSSDFGYKKQTGSLYKHIPEIINCPESVIMIGDNKTADFDMAINNGIDAIHIPYQKPKSIDVCAQLNNIYNINKGYTFSNYAFVFYSFIEAIYKRLLELNLDTVFFMAREGYFLIELFEHYQKDKEKKINSIYFYVSRKSTILASLKPEDEKDFTAIFKSYKHLDIQSFLKNLSFDDDEIELIHQEISIPIDKIFYNFHESNEFHIVIDSQAFKSILREKCLNAKKMIYEYINQNGDVLQKNNRIAVVDVGWKGTIQDNIYLGLDGKVTVYGLYLGYENNTGLECYNNIKEGLIFSKYPQKSIDYTKYDFETHLIEQILAAPSGSVAGYRNENGCINPVFEEYSDVDRELYAKAKPVQDSIMQEFEAICDSMHWSKYISSDQKDYFTHMHLKASLLLNLNEINFEKTALTSKTNNFGWFQKIPTRDSKKDKFFSFSKDVKQLLREKSGAMGILNYLAVKMNVRRKYVWKLVVYRIVYCFLGKGRWIDGETN